MYKDLHAEIQAETESKTLWAELKAL